MKRFEVALLGLCATAFPLACATVPQSPEGRQELQAAAEETLSRMKARDPSLAPVLENASGYAVFPNIGKGGAIVGGAYGRGILFEGGVPVGFVEMNQASLGLQLGGQTFSEIIVFQNDEALQRVQSGPFEVTADMSAVLVTSGAAATAPFNRGVAIFVEPKGGAMFEVSVSGQKLNFAPMG